MDAHKQEHILICTHTYTYTYRYKQTINNTARILAKSYQILVYYFHQRFYKSVSPIGQRSMWNVSTAKLVKILQSEIIC